MHIIVYIYIHIRISIDIIVDPRRLAYKKKQDVCEFSASGHTHSASQFRSPRIGSP